MRKALGSYKVGSSTWWFQLQSKIKHHCGQQILHGSEQVQQNKDLLTCNSLPSAGVISAMLAKTPSSVRGSSLKGITRIIAFWAKVRSASIAATSASPE